MQTVVKNPISNINQANLVEKENQCKAYLYVAVTVKTVTCIWKIFYGKVFFNDISDYKFIDILIKND